LRGFVLSAENNLKDAKNSFETAIALQSALGDAWLGRGLCLIKQGQLEAGRRDLLTAAALEPNRAIFRRYLSENFSTVSGGPTTPKQTNARPEKTPKPKSRNPQTTSRAEKAATSKPRYVQSTPAPQKTAPPTPYVSQPASGIQIGIGIGRGQVYTHPAPRPTRPPQHPAPNASTSDGVAVHGSQSQQHTDKNKSTQKRKSTSSQTPR